MITVAFTSDSPSFSLSYLVQFFKANSDFQTPVLVPIRLDRDGTPPAFVPGKTIIPWESEAQLKINYPGKNKKLGIGRKPEGIYAIDSCDESLPMMDIVEIREGSTSKTIIWVRDENCNDYLEMIRASIYNHVGTEFKMFENPVCGDEHSSMIMDRAYLPALKLLSEPWETYCNFNSRVTSAGNFKFWALQQ